MMPRDSQKSRVLSAIAAVGDPHVSRLERERYGAKCIASRWWGRLGEAGPARSSSDTPCGYRWPLDPWNDWTSSEVDVLHALAHCWHRDDERWHGPEFCKQMLVLVQHFKGVAAAKALRAEFKSRKVKTRVVSPETRELQRQRYIARQTAALLEGKEVTRRARPAPMAEIDDLLDGKDLAAPKWTRCEICWHIEGKERQAILTLVVPDAPPRCGWHHMHPDAPRPVGE